MNQPARRRVRLRSLGVKLGLVLFIVVTAAVAIVYLAVVPRLESRLVNETTASLRKASPSLSRIVRAAANRFQYQNLAEFASTQVDARVVIFERLGAEALVPVADSRPVRSADVLRDPVALQAVESGRVSEGRVTRDGQDFAEVATPVADDTVLLLSASLEDELSAVAVVRRSVLIAGGIALAASWLAGSLAALKLIRRIRRLEIAAEQLADGDFDVKVRDSGRDEVGELARAFDRMRIRLSDVDRARREFVANASHELRTPLFALGGFLELLADEELDEGTRRDFVETARTQVERLTRLATDLLDLSRLDAGQMELEAEPVDLVATAQSLVEEFRPLAEATGHTLRVTSTGDVVAVGDADRILQIGRSLVENALRHTPAGGVVEVKASVWVDHAELAVHDTGDGIRADEQEHVFERFYRGEGGAAFGSGLGLTIARELAQRMGGTISLRSQSGDTTFTLALPRAKTAVAFSRENALV